MQSNDQAGQVEDANNEKCDHCGTGFTPDERMNFKDIRATDIQKAMHSLIDQVQLHLLSIECMSAKLIQIDEDKRATGMAA